MDVVGVGYPCIDFLLNVDAFPAAESHCLLRDYSWQGGGPVPTALVALGRLGACAGLIGVVGGDSFGRFLSEDFRRHGVDTSRLVVDEAGETSLSVPVSDRQTGSRSFIFNFGTCRKLRLEDLDADYIRSAKFLHLADMSPVSRAAAEIARQGGVTVSIDAGYSRSILPEDLGLVDVLVASESYYEEHFGGRDCRDSCEAVLRAGPRIAVFTFGSRGCAGMDGEGYFELPAFKVPVADTTGAGDVYHGAFLYGLLQGWKAGESARFASAVAAIKCTRIGGRAGIPDLATALKFLGGGEIDCEEIDSRVAFYRNIRAG